MTVVNPYLPKSKAGVNASWQSSSKPSIISTKIVVTPPKKKTTSLANKSSFEDDGKNSRPKHSQQMSQKYNHQSEVLSKKLKPPSPSSAVKKHSPLASGQTQSSHTLTPTHKPKNKNNGSKSNSTKPTKKINLKASFKAHLRKEINNLKKQKQKHIQHQNDLKHQKNREEQKKQKLLEKQRMDREKEQRRLHKIQEKLRKKEAMKLKLQRDLEMKQKIEEEKIEKKKREKEERERLKQEKRKEREAQRRLEMEKKREEARKIQQMEHQQVMQSQMILAQQMQMQAQVQAQAQSQAQSQAQAQAQAEGSKTVANLRNNYAQSQIRHNVYQNIQQSSVTSPTLTEAVINKQQPYSTYQMNLFNPSNHQLVNRFNPYYQTHAYSQMSSFYTTNNAVYTFNPYSSPFGLSLNPYYNNPTSFSNIMTPSHKLIKSRSTTSTTTTPKKKHIPTQKSMILHENPLELPSPFVKTHVILPYRIVITKEEGQTFGVNIRYETRGTFVEMIEKEEEGSKEKKILDGERRNDDIRNDQTTKIASLLIPQSSAIDEVATVTETQQTPMVAKKKIDSGIIVRGSDKCIHSNETKIAAKGEDDLIEENESPKKDQAMIPSLPLSLLSGASNETPVAIERPTPMVTKMEGDYCFIEEKQITNTMKSSTHSTIDVSKESKIAALENQGPNDVNPPPASIETLQTLTQTNPTLCSPLGGVNVSGTTNDTLVGSNQMLPTVPIVTKKPKKKKILFGVMSVIGAEKQNSRAAPSTTQDKLIQTNDIILKIDDKNIAGMTFQDAAKLFSQVGTTTTTATSANGNNNSSDGEEINKVIHRCVLTVAREKKVMKIINKLASLEQTSQEPIRKKKTIKPKEKEQSAQNNADENTDTNQSTEIMNVVTKVPLVIDENKNLITSGNFSAEEVEALLYGVRHCFGNIESFVDSTVNLESVTLFGEISKNPLFGSIIAKRDARDFLRKWFHETGNIENKLNATALKKLKENWTNEDGDENSASKDKVEFMLESQRSLMRNLPRPSRGCKCGSLDHEYISDPKCILYRNIRRMFPTESTQSNISKKKLFEKYEGKLNSIGTAQLQRVKKRMEIEVAERAEAKFVAKMEHLQLSRLNMAIFSPNVLTVLVLSAIASFQEKMKGKSDRARKKMNTEEVGDEMMEEGGGSPGKRRSDQEEKNDETTKRRKLDVQLVASSYCLAELLLLISNTWGHLYKEPDHEHYAWYEECRQNEKSSNAFERNPREPGQFSFEVLKYVLDESLVRRLKQQTKSSDEIESNLDDQLFVLHLASDFKTGLMKEINALVLQEIVEIDENGLTSIKDGWERRIDPFVLNDMYETGWSVELDIDNKFSIHKDVRIGLDSEWKHTAEGWLSKSGKKIVHYHHQYEYARQLFDGKFEDYMNEVHGIAQFGI